MANVKDKVIAITGGASGIGLATAKVLASRGAKLSIADVSEQNLEKAKALIKEAAPDSEDVMTMKCDVRKFSEVQDWIKKTVDKFGKLDGAANIAGTIGTNYSGYTLADEDPDQWDLIIGVNLTGVMHCMKAELQVMQSGASIVNAASVSGIRGQPNPGSAAYIASKHGVVGLTRSAAREFGSKNIRVNAIAPGYVDTPLMRGAIEVIGKDVFQDAAAAHPLGRKADPMEIGTVFAFLLSDDASFVTGAVYEVDAGWTA